MTAGNATCTVTITLKTVFFPKLREEKVSKVICLPLKSHKRSQIGIREAEYSVRPTPRP